MRYDWRQILSWTEVLCFVLVWCIGIGAALLQVYAGDSGAAAADLAVADGSPSSAAALD